MKVLVQHIENLLPEHDCVVVPGLGGFVQSEVQSRIQSGAKLFYPASKEIGFNNRLKFNDGLLAQSYQESDGMSFEESNIEIQKAVKEINEKLEEGKFIRLGRIGTLFMIEQQLVFRPDHHNHFYPEAFGLTPFTFPLLKKGVLQEESPSELTQEPIVVESKKSKDEFIHIRFHRHQFRQLIAGIAVCLFLVLLSKPAGNRNSASQEAGMMHNYLSTSIPAVPDSTKVITKQIYKPKDSILIKPESRSIVPTPGNQLNQAPKIDDNVPEITVNDLQGYYIIVSTFVQKTNAQRWLTEHEGDVGLKDAGIIEGEGHARVYLRKFTDKQKATKFLNGLTSSNPDYASAWLYSAKID